MTSYGFDENFDLDYDGGNQPQSGQKNMFSTLMDPSGQRRSAKNEFPDFDAPSGQHDTPWDSEDVWGEQPKAAGNPYGTVDTGYGGGFGGYPDFSALRGNTKPQEKPKPFHMDSMSLSYLEKEDAANNPQGYAGQDVLGQDVGLSRQQSIDVGLSRQQSIDYNPQAGGGQGPYGGQASPALQEEHKDDSMGRSQRADRGGHGPSRFKNSNNPIHEDEGEYNRQEEQQQWDNNNAWNRSDSNIQHQRQNSAGGMSQGQGGDPWQNQNQNQNQNQDQRSADQSPAYGYNQNARNSNEPYSAQQSNVGYEGRPQESPAYAPQYEQQQQQPNSGDFRSQKSIQRTDTNERIQQQQQQRNEWEDQNIHAQKQNSFGNNQQTEPASGGYGGSAATFGDTGNFGEFKVPGKSSAFEWEDTSHYFQDKPKKPVEPAQPVRDTHEDDFATYRTNQSVAEPAKEPAKNYNSNDTQNYQTPVTDTYRSGSGVSNLHSPYSENRMFVNDQPQSGMSSPPNNHLNRAGTSSFRPNIVEVQNDSVNPTGPPPALSSFNLEPKGIQKPRKPKAPMNVQEVQTENEDGEPKMVSAQTQSPKKGGRPSMAGNPRALGTEGDTLDILCSVHEGQYIERVCTHPRYKKKRLICWECGMDESKEIQKYRHSLLPVTQYALQNLEEYSKREGPEIPEELKKSLGRLESMKEMYGQDITVNTTDLKRSLEVMKRQILEKFEEINQTIDDMAHKKVGSFDINRTFFRHTLDTYYPDTSKQKVSASVLYDTLKHVQNENEFQDFIKSLKPEVDPSAPEIKNYLRVLSHKIDTQELKLPNKDHFAQIHNKNLKVIQLQEQIVANLDGVKSSLTELINTSYQVEDITKTRIVTPKSLTQDTLATLAPINKISNELVRYRLQYEKKLSTPESKSITCIANIDNEIIAAGAMDKTITFWRISTSEILDTIVGHDDAISGLYTYQVCMSDLKSRVPQTNNFNEDAVTLLVSTGGKLDNSILFWDISWMHDYIRGKIQTKQQTKLIRRLEGHESGATAVLPMTDGATLISGAYDGKITVWNVLKNKVIGEIQHHTSAVSCLRLMRCNERYASASWDKTICIWRIFYKDLYDPETGIHSDRRLFEGFEMEKIIDPSFKIMCMNASLVKKNWLVFGGSINRVIVWDVDEGRLVKEFECENNNLTDVLLVEDEQKEKMILLGVCNDDDVVRGWDTNFQETEGLIREAYNIKNKKRIYINKSSINGALLRFVEDGRLRMASVNCANNKELISLWDVQLGI